MNDNTLDQLVELVRSRYYGKYRGTVIDVEDSEKKGRVKVSVPAVLGDLNIWAMPCVPYSGSNAGHYFVPEVGAGIWVEFEGGDPSYPIWVGGFWKDGDAPKNEKGNDPIPSVKVVRSKQGLIVSMDDDGQVITLSDGDNNNFITIEVQPGKIKLKGNMKIVVESPLIELVENAAHPVVFGDDLLNYLSQLCQLYNSHMHPGELALGFMPVTPAPPVPPFTPPTPALLSTKVKTG
jgi:Type VI secretion system/phage-baseplate injector OB domain